MYGDAVGWNACKICANDRGFSVSSGDADVGAMAEDQGRLYTHGLVSWSEAADI